MGEKKTILLVDDEPDITRIVIFRLKKEGYDVIVAKNGKEALEFAHNNPDLILLDVLLPDIDGYEVCRHIKSDPHLNRIPIIFFTASISEFDKLSKRVKKSGAQDYVVKPYNWKEVLLKIRKYI